MKTSELTGAALDWAVGATGEYGCGFFSTDWSKGGPIIERENINFWTSNSWQDERGNFTSIKTAKHPTSTQHHNGETPLIAAMRCYVSSKLGDEVELPEELEVTA